MSTSYIEKLKDPRWQKKRLKILERDKWTCQDCEATDDTLHVHHFYYLQGKSPWEYPDNALITLCQNCHKQFSETQRTITQQIIEHNDLAFWHYLAAIDFTTIMQDYYNGDVDAIKKGLKMFD